MVFIISGPVGSGKTTRLEELYSHYFKADGYILKKAYKQHSVYIGQNILRLSDRHEMPFTRLTNHLPDYWAEKDRILNYSFSERGLMFAKSIINNIITKGTKIAFIDEIGPLELSLKGVSKEFSELLKTADNIYVTIRKDCLHEAIKTFNINNFVLI